MNDDELVNLLGALSLALGDAQMTAAGAASGLAASACATVVTVGAHPGETISRLATILALSHSATVRLVEDLARRGLVERSLGMDRRQVRLALSTAGVATRAAILEARRRRLALALAAVGGADRDRFAAGVSAILAGLAVDEATSDHICRLCDEDACAAPCPADCLTGQTARAP